MSIRACPTLVALLIVPVGLSVTRDARCQAVPSPTELPAMLTLPDAVSIFRTHGIDMLLADAATRSAEGDVLMASAVANPTVSASVGNVFTYANTRYSRRDCLQGGAACPPWIYDVGVSDSGALSDWLSGKRGLRVKVAKQALAAAKMQRADAERLLGFSVKAAYLQVAQSVLGLAFAREVVASNATTLAKFQERYNHGAIDEGDLQRMETEKLESEQALESALSDLRQARVGLAYLLGVRGAVPDFEVDTHVLDFMVPGQIRDASESELLRLAFTHRPDLIGMGFTKNAAQAQVNLARRSPFPDIALNVDYAFGGFGGTSANGPPGPQTLTVGLSASLPVFYHMQGEVRQAQAMYDTAALQEAQLTSSTMNDVLTASAGFVASRKLVERMEGPRRPGGGLLASAKGAFDVMAYQYEKGAATLTDYLDALRAYVATRTEYFGNLTDYWTAVYQLETAVGMSLQ